MRRLLLVYWMLLVVAMALAGPVPVEEQETPTVVQGAEELHDLDTAEFILKIIEKKIYKLLKKCYKLGGCQYDDDYGHGYGGYGGGYAGDSYGYAPAPYY